MKLINLKKVRELTSLSYTTIWRLERLGTFPQRVQISHSRVGWIEDEVLFWLESRPRKK